MLHALESRQLLSSSPVYDAHATVSGRPLRHWGAEYWKNVFSIPVFKNDGKTYKNPQFLEGKDAVAGASDKKDVRFLYGNFTGGAHDRTVTVSEGTKLFVPIINFEWSNPDTPAAPDYTSVPGHYNANQLAQFAKTQTNSVNALSAKLDGKNISNLFSHREAKKTFGYNLPAKNNIMQVFFNENISGRVSPASQDGYYLMFKPMSKGWHTIYVSGKSKDLSSTPPLLGAFDGSTTYHVHVIAKASAAAKSLFSNSSASTSNDSDLLV